MKLQSTTLVSKGLVTKSIIVASICAMTITSTIGDTKLAFARDYAAEINALQSQIDQYQAQARELNDRAKTLQSEIAALNAEKAAIQAQIDVSQAKYDKLQRDIADTERKIFESRTAMGKVIAEIYTDDQITPLEMLASSKGIADYIDKQEYRSSISNGLQRALERIRTLKAQLEQQKIDTERVLGDQKNARAALVVKENEQADLLARTQNDEAAFQRLSADAQAEKEKVAAAQQAEIRRRYAGGGGGSLIAGSSLGNYAAWVGGDCYVDNRGYSHGVRGGQDPLGYGCNQCVSYTAWKMIQKTGYGPSYWGNANMWPNSARNAGFTVSRTPRANSIGVIMAGQWGHVVYVESYSAGSGTVNISQYNEWLPGLGYGYYSERNGVSAAQYDWYIYL